MGRVSFAYQIGQSNVLRHSAAYVRTQNSTAMAREKAICGVLVDPGRQHMGMAQLLEPKIFSRFLFMRSFFFLELTLACHFHGAGISNSAPRRGNDSSSNCFFCRLE
jgi:hypothetical protein